MVKKKVMVIDDEPDNLNLVADLLEFGGAQVAQATGGRQGLALIDEFHPNLILLDLAMPDLDGWEMHRILRSRPDARDLLIVALTALAMQPAGSPHWSGPLSVPLPAALA